VMPINNRQNPPAPDCGINDQIMMGELRGL
jgi:hypothetical protein